MKLVFITIFRFVYVITTKSILSFQYFWKYLMKIDLWAIGSNNFIWNLKSRLIVANNLRHQFIRNSIAKWPKFNKSFYYNLQSFVLMNISSSSLKDAITSAPNSKYPRPHQGSPIRYSQKSLAFWTKSLLHLKEGLTCLFLYDRLRPCILSGFAHRGFQWSS